MWNNIYALTPFSMRHLRSSSGHASEPYVRTEQQPEMYSRTRRFSSTYCDCVICLSLPALDMVWAILFRTSAYALNNNVLNPTAVNWGYRFLFSHHLRLHPLKNQRKTHVRSVYKMVDHEKQLVLFQSEKIHLQNFNFHHSMYDELNNIEQNISMRQRIEGIKFGLPTFNESINEFS